MAEIVLQGQLVACFLLGVLFLSLTVALIWDDIKKRHKRQKAK